VALERAGHPRPGYVRGLRGSEHRLAQGGLEGEVPEPAQATHDRPAPGQVDDRGLDPHVARPAVDDEQPRDVVEVGEHVVGRRRADAPEAVGGGRGDPVAERPQQRQRHRVRRHPQRHRRLARR
jgi:hypothetical protein